jgi:hypothetical protein
MRTDIERRWHQTHVSDEDAKPMLGRMSGASMIVFLGSISVSVVVFAFLTELVGLSAVGSLPIAGLPPLGTFWVLLRYVVGKPKGYARSVLELRRLQRSNTPLLSEIETDEK